MHIAVLLLFASFIAAHPEPSTIYDSLLHVPGIAAANDFISHGANAPFSGVTVVVCPDKCSAAMIQLGGSPCTSQTDALKIDNFGVKQVSAVTLSGGSMYGLYGSSLGAFQCITHSDHRIQKQNVFDYDLPHVSSAGLLDLGFHTHNMTNSKYQDTLIDEYKNAAYSSCKRAIENHYSGEKELRQGNTGAGTGAAVGQILFDVKRMMKGGLGSAAIHITEGIYVGAVIAVNVLGEVTGETGTTLAGLLTEKRDSILPYDHILSNSSFIGKTQESYASTTNTAIGVIVTNLKMNKAELRKVTEMSMQGLFESVYPASSIYDGDTIFALSTEKIRREDIYGDREIDPVTPVGTFARKALALAIRRSVCCAKDLNGVKSVLRKELCKDIYEQFHDKLNCSVLEDIVVEVDGSIQLK
jgi:L-aminopeptidase/D-esterase-like protein